MRRWAHGRFGAFTPPSAQLQCELADDARGGCALCEWLHRPLLRPLPTRLLRWGRRCYPYRPDATSGLPLPLPPPCNSHCTASSTYAGGGIGGELCEECVGDPVTALAGPIVGIVVVLAVIILGCLWLRRDPNGFLKVKVRVRVRVRAQERFRWLFQGDGDSNPHPHPHSPTTSPSPSPSPLTLALIHTLLKLMDSTGSRLAESVESGMGATAAVEMVKDEAKAKVEEEVQVTLEAAAVQSAEKVKAKAEKTGGKRGKCLLKTVTFLGAYGVKLRILISMFQLLSGITENFNVPFPNIFTTAQTFRTYILTGRLTYLSRCLSQTSLRSLRAGSPTSLSVSKQAS